MTKERICCPLCQRDEGVHLICEAPALVRIPVVDGKLSPQYEILAVEDVPPSFTAMEDSRQLDLGFEDYCDELAPTAFVMLRFSSVDCGTSITIFPPEEVGQARLHCPVCKKVSNIDLSLLGGCG